MTKKNYWRVLMLVPVVLFSPWGSPRAEQVLRIDGSGALQLQSDSGGQSHSAFISRAAGDLIVAAQSCINAQGKKGGHCEDAIIEGIGRLEVVEQYITAQAIFFSYPCYGKAEGKRKFTEMAIRAGRVIGDFELVAVAYYNRAVCYWNTNDFGNAFELMKPLVNTVTRFAVVDSGESDQQLLEETAALLPAWRNLVRFAENTQRVRPEICRKAGPEFCPELAWQVMEKIKGRLFRLAATRNAVRGPDSAALMAKLAEQKALLIARESNRLGIPEFNSFQSLPPATIDSRLADLGGDIIATAPSLAIASGLHDPTLKDIRSLLRPGESYVSFLTVMDGRKPVFVQVRNDGSPVVGLAGEDALVIRNLVAAYREALRTKDAARENEVGQRLARALLGRIDLAGVNRLLLSVDGNLAGVPFALLPLQGKRLGQRMAVTYVPSGGIFRHLRTTQHHVVHQVPYVGFARERFTPPLPDLIGANDEVRNAAIFMDGGTRRAVAVTDAGKADIIRQSAAIAEARVLHFATHAAIQDGFLGLELGDGRLESYEIVQTLNTRAELAILSACNTAQSTAQLAEHGEAFSDMARAFFSIGTRRLLVTQWPIENNATRILVTQFLERLRDSDAESALAGAQEDLRRLRPEYSSAYFWGGFILMGD
ncbi:MAG: CHAT domain-containing protein [Alphaproteobacteria bacterium]|nr:CHAT domain-containing protein [Alphaproteobacteria bacterium]